MSGRGRALFNAERAEERRARRMLGELRFTLYALRFTNYVLPSIVGHNRVSRKASKATGNVVAQARLAAWDGRRAGTQRAEITRMATQAKRAPVTETISDQT